MNKIYKISSIVLVVILIVITLLFFLKFSGVSDILNSSQPNTVTIIYIYWIIAFVTGCILFGIAFKLSNTKQQVESISSYSTNSADSNIKPEKLDAQNEKVVELEERVKNSLIEIDSGNSLVKYTERVLSVLAKEFSIVQGLFFTKDFKTELYELSGTYAFYSQEKIESFKSGEGLNGQVAKNKKIILVSNIPDGYITVLSGLGSSSPKHLIIFPIIFENESIGVVELASFSDFGTNTEDVFSQVAESISGKLVKLLNKG